MKFLLNVQYASPIIIFEVIGLNQKHKVLIDKDIMNI